MAYRPQRSGRSEQSSVSGPAVTPVYLAERPLWTIVRGVLRYLCQETVTESARIEGHRLIYRLRLAGKLVTTKHLPALASTTQNRAGEIIECTTACNTLPDHLRI